ncbi:MAG: starch synthase [Acidobacteria bacterium RIFCSPLOWO2_12_FULL_65_11]|nr:MAG: starch synthase [Acidobacteria bacterium RIFCSPLOWO2_02_FULL_64_15]OFW31016.1 MAG: starch synthase [Acidobacteria bacterium RIFCSPLOWO2_12_FULL_65_11]
MPSRKKPGSVLIIGSEAVPFAKTGGLADVLGTLPQALARLGWDVTLALPRYRGVDEGSLAARFPLTVGGYTREVGIFEVSLAGGSRAWLVDCPDVFDREGIYGPGGGEYSDNPRRFAMLVRAALEFAALRGARPSVVHAHDWQAGLAPVYLKTRYATHSVLGGIPSVFTIHNLAYQGLFDADWLPRLDLGWDLFSIDRLEYWGRISLLKGGINEAEVVTAVSPRYAEEIQTPEFGFGFDGILRRRRADLAGVLNGIDVERWDPEHDPFLPRPYSADDLSGKDSAKAEVLVRYRLATDGATLKRPLVAMISRMIDQKGFDLMAALADELPRLEATFIVLGTGETRYQDLWTGLAARHPDRIGAHIGFDEALAHLIEAGADIFLMPSRFEPCGLSQMYSLRYGTVPVVRAVGGLADTVVDYAPSRRFGGASSSGHKKSTGFVFQEYTPQGVLEALNRALALYADPKRWKALQRAGMAQDHSWDRSAREYVRIYERAIKKGFGIRDSGFGVRG